MKKTCNKCSQFLGKKEHKCPKNPAIYLGKHAILGYEVLIEVKKKISDSHKGKKKPWAGKYKRTDAHRKHISEALKKRKITWGDKISKALRGDRAWAWKGGVSTQNRIDRTRREYFLWRNSVFERDGFICQFCGQAGGKLQADHIKPFAKFPELRYEISNGRTLCISCHKTTETYGNSKYYMSV